MRITKYLLLMGVCLTGLSATLSATCSPAGTGGNYYVATTGSDSNSGSSCSPWRTISHAARLVKPGWTVHVAPGTYTEDIAFTTSGTAASRIRFVSDTRWGARIVGRSANMVWQIGNANTSHGGNYVDIVGFEVVGSLTSTRGIATYGNNNRILNNKIHDVPAAGSRIGCPSNGGAGAEVVWNGVRDTTSQINNVFDGNYIYNIGLYGQTCNSIHGIYISTPQNTISNNVVFRVSGYGIHCYHFSTKEKVINNTVFLANTGDILISSDGSILDDYSTVSNNIAINGRGHGGIQEESYPAGHIGTHNVISNNLTYGNSPTNYLLDMSVARNARTSGSTSTTFVNYTGTQTGDYRLKVGSPAINAGASTLAPPTDINGGWRPQFGAFDIGAYEQNALPGAWPWQQ